jgi:hypothetical protein
MACIVGDEMKMAIEVDRGESWRSEAIITRRGAVELCGGAFRVTSLQIHRGPLL